MYLSVRGRVPDALYGRMLQATSLAKGQRKPQAVDEWLWSDGTTEYAVMARPKGHQNFRYAMLVEGFWEIAVGSEFDKRGETTGLVQLRSQYLWTGGFVPPMQQVCRLLGEVFGPDVEIKANRIDVCADFQKWYMVRGDKDRFVTRAWYRDEWPDQLPKDEGFNLDGHDEMGYMRVTLPALLRAINRAGQLATMYVGSSGSLVQTRLYRKDWQMQVSRKSGFYAEIAEQNGWVPIAQQVPGQEDPVLIHPPLVRVEAQLRGEYLGQFDKRRDPFDLVNSLGDIMEDVWSRQIRFVKSSGSSELRKRETVDWWEHMPRLFANLKTGLVRTMEKPSPEEDALLDAMIGYASSLAVMNRWTETDTWTLLLRKMKDRLATKGDTLTERIERKAEERGIVIPSLSERRQADSRNVRPVEVEVDLPPVDHQQRSAEHLREVLGEHQAGADQSRHLAKTNELLKAAFGLQQQKKTTVQDGGPDQGNLHD